MVTELLLSIPAHQSLSAAWICWMSRRRQLTSASLQTVPVLLPRQARGLGISQWRMLFHEASGLAQIVRMDHRFCLLHFYCFCDDGLISCDIFPAWTIHSQAVRTHGLLEELGQTFVCVLEGGMQYVYGNLVLCHFHPIYGHETNSGRQSRDRMFPLLAPPATLSSFFISPYRPCGFLACFAGKTK